MTVRLGSISDVHAAILHGAFATEDLEGGSAILLSVRVGVGAPPEKALEVVQESFGYRLAGHDRDYAIRELAARRSRLASWCPGLS